MAQDDLPSFKSHDSIASRGNWDSIQQPVRQIRRKLSVRLNVFGNVESQKSGARVVSPPKEIIILSLEVATIGTRNREFVPAEVQPGPRLLGLKIGQLSGRDDRRRPPVDAVAQPIDGW
jgi:hypothetical protein